ncbi:MAG: aminotransferase class I/II-fold pyridoxal phosphate-dependent enzyme [Selenomonadaceae bacterium]|nr:aminotransferase class I/II-fold pyridoxal phosphate-dependent enzyme [Selenomonadaceae bacterium]
MNKNNFAPIADAMQKYSADGALAFHTPGHKQGRGAHSLLKNLVTAEGLRQEVSLMEELDDLHSPHSCIKAAEKFAAELWHADDALFMINGTSSAIQAMILATLKPNDLVFVPRNSHRAVTAGLILSGAVPIFLPVDFSAELKIPLNVTASTIRRAIKKFPQARALILTSPNYYGVAADVKGIAEILHAAGMLLLVDEAHGAHLQFCERLPISAMDAGADLAAQSTHKLLGSMTQTSMLMVRKNFVDVDAVRRAASLLQTTSPNQLLLASLDIARLQMAEVGREKILNAIELSQHLRAEVEKISALSTFDAVKDFELDLTKVTVNVEGAGLTGIDAEKILRHKFKVQCELSDAANLLFIISYADDDAVISKLVDALKSMSKAQCVRRDLMRKAQCVMRNDFSYQMPAKTPREIFFAESEIVPLEKSVGRICAEEVTFYPPGIPILNIGERITAEVVKEISALKKIGNRALSDADFIKVLV